MRLQGKNIFVTGGSRGIGTAIARACAAEGANVAISFSSSEAKAREVVESLGEGHHFLVQMDLRNEESIENAFKQVFEKFETLDGLVNNAGLTRDQLFLRMKTNDFDEVIQANLRGSFLCMKQVAKPMTKKRSGAIVNIASVIGQTGNPGQVNYAASKAGLIAMSKSLGQELASRNIRINNIAPGFIATDMTGDLSESIQEEILKKIPMGRIGDAEDIARAALFLLCDDSKYMTGQTLNVNGGMYMGG